MACTVSIAPPIALTNSAGQIESILIGGTGNGCERVLVDVSCGNNSYSVQPPPPVVNGAWSVMLTVSPVLQCQCNGNINIEVSANDGQCGQTFNGMLNCLPPSTCPALQFLGYTYSDCQGGKRVVNGNVSITPNPNNPVGATLFIDGIAVGSHAASSGMYAVPFTATLNPGMSNLLCSFTDMDCGSSSMVIDIPPCLGCPNIDFQTVEGACEDGERSVTVVAKIPVLAPGAQVDATLFHGTKQIASANQSGAITLTGSDQFPGGLNTVSVEISNPVGCAPTSFMFMVTPCSGPPVANIGGGGGGGGGGSLGCILSRAAVVMLFGTAIMFLIAYLCVPANVSFGIAAAAALVVAFVLYFLWLKFCGSKCGSILVWWESFYFGAWLAAYMVICCPLAIFAMLLFGGAAIGLFIYWVVKCKPSACAIFQELVWVTTVPVALVFALLKNILPCGAVSGVEALEIVVAAAFATALLATCKAQGTSP